LFDTALTAPLMVVSGHWQAFKSVAEYRFLTYRNGRGMHRLLTPGWYFVLTLSQGEQQNEP
jgi:hypothetical protein